LQTNTWGMSFFKDETILSIRRASGGFLVRRALGATFDEGRLVVFAKEIQKQRSADWKLDTSGGGSAVPFSPKQFPRTTHSWHWLSAVVRPFAAQMKRLRINGEPRHETYPRSLRHQECIDPRRRCRDCLDV
jgi:hypothetical protein